MRKSERKQRDKWKLILRKAQKETRKGKRIAVMCGIRGVTILVYIFTPGEKGVDRRGAIDDISSLFTRLKPEMVWYVESNEYPAEMLMRERQDPDNAKFIKLSYQPHRVLEIIRNMHIPGHGRKLGFIFDEFKGVERSFRAALAVLIRERLIVVTRNGFLWTMEDAKKVLGTTLDVTAKEIYK